MAQGTGPGPPLLRSFAYLRAAGSCRRAPGPGRTRARARGRAGAKRNPAGRAAWRPPVRLLSFMLFLPYHQRASRPRPPFGRPAVASRGYAGRLASGYAARPAANRVRPRIPPAAASRPPAGFACRSPRHATHSPYALTALRAAPRARSPRVALRSPVRAAPRQRVPAGPVRLRPPRQESAGVLGAGGRATRRCSRRVLSRPPCCALGLATRRAGSSLARPRAGASPRPRAGPAA